MKIKLLGVLVAGIMLTIIFSGCNERDTEKTIVIQELIDSALPGDTINIPSGTYYENIVINKAITLIGENKETTIIVGGNSTDDVICINEDGVKIKYFTITKGNVGISVNSNYNNISDNIISDNDYQGIYLNEFAQLNTIFNNKVINNNYIGIGLRFSNYSSIIKNYIANNEKGVHLWTSLNNTISGNNITNNIEEGIYSYHSSYNNITKNVILKNNRYGIYLSGLNDNLCNNLITSNYIKNNTYYGIILVRTNNNTIYKNNIIGNDHQARDDSNNIWYDTRILKGNYWDDYAGSDSERDGIGDEPYDIQGGKTQDNYPLMNPIDI